jgi:hypothetical protein
MSKPPKKRKCPGCGKMGNRVWSPPGLIFKGFGWDTNSYRDKKYIEKGMDKDTANEFLDKACDYSKDRMKTGGDVYSRWVPDCEKMVKEGKAKRVSKKKTVKKIEESKKLTETHYKKMGVKPGWKEK